MKFKEYINESKTIIYHGDNFSTKKLESKLMNNGNNQEGIGIYFGSLETAKAYGKNIIHTEIDTKKFINSRGEISKFLKLSEIINILTDMYKEDVEAMYYIITDWGIEISEPEDIEEYMFEELAQNMSNDDVRDFQTTLANTFGVVPFVESWNKHTKIDGTYQDQGNDIWYAVINTKIKVKQIKEI